MIFKCPSVKTKFRRKFIGKHFMKRKSCDKVTRFEVIK